MVTNHTRTNVPKNAQLVPTKLLSLDSNYVSPVTILVLNVTELVSTNVPPALVIFL